jgi:UDP-N-acetylmuramate--alanine ligase
LITKDKITIAVAGSHGKTTVSTMIAFILKECGIDCSAFLGGISVNFDSNYVYGESEYVVVEADEFDQSFLRLSPNYIVLTSIDTDHLDIYGSRDQIVASFQEFLDLLPDDGELIFSENVKDHMHSKGKQSTYGFGNEDIHASQVNVFPTYSTFFINNGSIEFKLNYNGRHNIENALAAIAVGKKLGISEEQLSVALSNFKGIKRRFELIYQDEKITYIDDYAHHPTEIEALLNSIREIYPNQRILSIFQPHLFSRTKDLCDDFAKALNLSDEIILLPIYPARELPIEGVSSEIISNKIDKPVSIVDKAAVLSAIKLRHCRIILTIGAGDISLLVPKIKKMLSE